MSLGQPRSISTLISPACKCMCLSGAFNPPRSSMSLLASSCTYSDLLSLADSRVTWCRASVACVPKLIPYPLHHVCLDMRLANALEALTLPLSPALYPAALLRRLVSFRHLLRGVLQARLFGCQTSLFDYLIAFIFSSTLCLSID